MKPDMKTCLTCGKSLEGRKTYCNDACRMAYKRNPNKQPEQPEQKTEQNHSRPNKPNTKPEQNPAKANNPNINPNKLTKTDRTFYDRAMRDFKNPYYDFRDETHEDVCALSSCRAKFKTSLSLLRYCSYEHYADSLAGRK